MALVSTLAHLQETKVCSRCGETRPLAAFSVAKPKPPRYTYPRVSSRCKRCKAEVKVQARLDGRWSPSSHSGSPAWTFAKYDELFLAQRGLCAICAQPSNGERFAIDHDHLCCPLLRESCGQCVRGLVHRNCNLAMGLLLDDPDLLEAAAAYIRRHRA